jgi:hypothetical protein
MAGYYAMSRGWMDHDFFASEPYTEREAWLYLIETAAWKPRQFCHGNDVIELQRGQLVTSIRSLASKWKWGNKRVDGFLKRLKRGAMVETEKGTRGTLLTICNYNKFQTGDDEKGTREDTLKGTRRGHGGDTNKEGKERKEYKYTGKVVRLNESDYGQWQKIYHSIPDFDAEIARIDAYLESSGKTKGWFPVASAMLNAKHQQNMERRQKPNGDGSPGNPSITAAI